MSMIDDVGHLIGEKTDVDGVTHSARIGGCPIELVVSLVVPCKSADSGPGVQPKCVEG